MGLFDLPPDVKTALSNLDEVREDITAIRRLLERLVELEEKKTPTPGR